MSGRGRWDGWRRRSPTSRARLGWGAAYLVGLWLFAVHSFLKDRGRQDLLTGNRPLYGLVAAVTYWPAACLAWRLLYPSDHRLLPWPDYGEDE